MPDKEISVLFVSHSSDLGGAERCLLSLLEALDRDRFRPVVALPGHGRMFEELAARQIPTRQMPMRWWLGIRSGSAARRHLFAYDLESRVEGLVNLIAAERIDLVFSNSLVMLDGALAARMAGKAHVWHVLEMLDRDPDLRPLIPLEQFQSLLCRLTDRVIAVSASVADGLRPQLGEGKLSVVHTGIKRTQGTARHGSKQSLFGVSEGESVISYAGLLSRRKGVLTLAEAMKHVIAVVPSARLAFAGADGGVEKELRKTIQASGLASVVRLMGYRSDALQIIGASDLFVLPAVADPFPVAVLEAMSLGTPVVATRSGGCTEMLEDGDSGYLVPCGDPRSLADAIIKVLIDPVGARAMGARAQVRVDRFFRIDQQVQATERILMEAAQLDRQGSTKDTAHELVRSVIAASGLANQSLLASLGGFGLRVLDRLRSGPIPAARRLPHRT